MGQLLYLLSSLCQPRIYLILNPFIRSVQYNKWVCVPGVSTYVGMHGCIHGVSAVILNSK